MTTPKPNAWSRQVACGLQTCRCRVLIASHGHHQQHAACSRPVDPWALGHWLPAVQRSTIHIVALAQGHELTIILKVRMAENDPKACWELIVHLNYDEAWMCSRTGLGSNAQMQRRAVVCNSVPWITSRGVSQILSCPTKNLVTRFEIAALNRNSIRGIWSLSLKTSYSYVDDLFCIRWAEFRVFSTTGLVLD